MWRNNSYSTTAKNRWLPVRDVTLTSSAATLLGHQKISSKCLFSFLLPFLSLADECLVMVDRSYHSDSCTKHRQHCNNNPSTGAFGRLLVSRWLVGCNLCSPSSSSICGYYSIDLATGQEEQTVVVWQFLFSFSSVSAAVKIATKQLWNSIANREDQQGILWTGAVYNDLKAWNMRVKSKESQCINY